MRTNKSDMSYREMSYLNVMQSRESERTKLCVSYVMWKRNK